MSLISYLLFVRCDKEVKVRTRSREFAVPEGELVYVGSCKRDCAKRVGRHFSSEKREFWHVDYLLEECEAVSALLTTLEERELAKLFLDCPYVEGFGSSDDENNPSHLFLCSFNEAVRRVVERAMGNSR